MKLYYILVLGIIFLMQGCGNAKSSYIKTKGAAQLGYLANADVKIYEVENNGHLKLLFTEKTSDGDILEEIGSFEMHLKDLQSNKYYVYEVSGGQDWDYNDNGIKDNKPTDFNGTFRAFIKGETLKEVGTDFKITPYTELLYQELKYFWGYFSTNITYFDKLLGRNMQNILTDTFNTSYHYGTHDPVDIYRLNPINSNYLATREAIVKNIYDNKNYNLLANIDIDVYFDLDKISYNDTYYYYNDTVDNIFIPTKDPLYKDIPKGQVQLSNFVSNVEVFIYEVQDSGYLKLLFTEKTDKNGNFNIHYDDIDNDKYYIYEVNSTKTGAIRAFVKGTTIKKVGNNFKINPYTELVFQTVKTFFKTYFANNKEYFDALLQKNIEEISSKLMNYKVKENQNYDYILYSTDISKVDTDITNIIIDDILYSSNSLVFKSLYDNKYKYFYLFYQKDSKYNYYGYSNKVSIPSDNTVFSKNY